MAGLAPAWLRIWAGDGAAAAGRAGPGWADTGTSLSVRYPPAKLAAVFPALPAAGWLGHQLRSPGGVCLGCWQVAHWQVAYGPSVPKGPRPAHSAAREAPPALAHAFAGIASVSRVHYSCAGLNHQTAAKQHGPAGSQAPPRRRSSLVTACLLRTCRLTSRAAATSFQCTPLSIPSLRLSM